MLRISTSAVVWISPAVTVPAPRVEPERDRLVRLDQKDDVLQVEDDVGDVFFDTGQSGELVERIVETDLGHRCAGYRRQQCPAQRHTKGVAKAGLQRPYGEALAVVFFLSERFDCWALDNEHCGGPPRGRYLEKSSTMSDSRTGTSMCSRIGKSRTVTSKPSPPVSSQGGIRRPRVSRLWRTTIRLARLVL